MKLKTITLAIALVFSPIYAADNDSGIEVGVGFGKYYFDHSSVDDETMGVLSVGYRFDKNWMAEIIRGSPDTDYKPGNLDIDVDWTALRGLYHFDTDTSYTPYISAGVGSIDTFSGENQVIVGLGIKGDFSSGVFWRLEGNYHTDESDTSVLAMIGFRFGNSGYAAPQAKDSDGDGVTDNVDACPNTPAGTKVDATGCAIKTNLDSDMDGVFDHLDKCPNTPAKALVDASGCQKVLSKEVSVNLQINFDTDKAIVKADYFSEIERVAKFMSDYAGTSVVIEGHTDDRGKAAHNQDLSTRRANAVASILSEKFTIAASRVEARGYGEDKPVADNNTVEGRSSNRRVVAVIKQQVEEKQWKE